MSVNLHAAITGWLSNGVREEVAQTGFAQINLDDLLGELPPSPAQNGLLCLELAVILARDQQLAVDGVLTIPLPATGQMSKKSPSIAEVLEPGDAKPGNGVPAISLVDGAHWRRYEDVEEYRTPLTDDAVPAGYAAYYRTWRSKEAADARGEYERAVCFRTVDGG